MESDDTIVEETPVLNIDESDSGDDSEPSVVVTQARKAQSSKRKRNGDKEEEYEIYAKTNSERATIWQYFDPVRVKKNGLRRALCKFCNKTIAASSSNGTSGLHKHYPCPSNPEYESKSKVQQQTHLEFKKSSNGEGTSSLQTWKHDESRIKKTLINMFVVGEIPSKFVEHEAFVEYTNARNGRFMLPSRHKLSRDVSKYYLDERSKLLAYLTKPTTTVHLTTDTWTSSCQKTNYMGIKNVMTMTVDNAPSNDKALDHLIKKLPNVKIYDDGKHFHIRCMAHILNLIVKEGLKEKNYHVECVANAVKYIRHSSHRINKFKSCMKDTNLESKRFLCGECPTRWNFKHDMLKIACSLREVFFKYELEDDCYYRDLERMPEHSYFGVCEVVVEFLEKFKTKTELISSSSKPLAHLFYREILDIDKHLCYWATKPEFCHMVDDMVKKYNREMLKEVVNRMGVLFQTYKIRFDMVVSKSSSKKTKNQQSCKSYAGENDFLDHFLNLEDSGSIEMDTELTRYLNEP
ncbi:zinc finger BED domain-containing protein RICESLEEPER 2 [Artemisia annua]|uniref:Zinc finger BED domain-containing protein RICESLEEPER 2 n=1 Tax=Artemisia annua TaxID=35608 RepID=A0A2U1NYH8_ARTAN|nr:zinc finger BED domain-containing protein RICESLEEPER 2 [Artemisia annua]